MKRPVETVRNDVSSRHSAKRRKHEKSNKIDHKSNASLNNKSFNKNLLSINFQNALKLSCKWYDMNSNTVISDDDKKIKISKNKNPLFKTQDEAIQYLKQQAEHIAKKTNKIKMNNNHYESIIKNGTFYDISAARVVQTQEKPLLCISNLKYLMKHSAQSNRRHALICIESLKDLFVDSLLPTDRKLHFFHSHPSITQNIISKLPNQLYTVKFVDLQLYLVWFEDILKLIFANFVLILCTKLEDHFDFVRKKITTFIYELLVAVPEQEKTLIGSLIEMLLDKTPKIASTASFYLNQLIVKHPPMTQIICSYVSATVKEQFVKRFASPKPNIHSFHHAISFLSTIKYSKKACGATIARQMVNTYLEIIEILLKYIETTSISSKRNNKQYHTIDSSVSAESVNLRFFRALLVGLSRALPYIKGAATTDLAESLVRLESSMSQLVDRCSNFSTKVSIFKLQYSLVTLLETNPTMLLDTLYKHIIYFKILHASKARMVLSLTRQVTNSLSLRQFATGLALYRRLHQVAGSLDCPESVVQCVWDLSCFLEKHKPYALEVLQQCDGSLELESREDDILKDFDRDIDDTGVSQLNNQSPSIVSSTYNPWTRTLEEVNADLAHLWELDLLSTSVHPTVAACAHALLNHNLKCSLISSKLAKLVPVSEDEKKKSKEKKNVGYMFQPQLESLSDTSVLHMFAYSSVAGGDSVISSDSIVNSTEYWDSKKIVFPHEVCMAAYFQDNYIRMCSKAKKEQVKSMRNRGDDESELFSEDEQHIETMLEKSLFGGGKQNVDSDDDASFASSSIKDDYLDENTADSESIEKSCSSEDEEDFSQFNKNKPLNRKMFSSQKFWPVVQFEQHGLS